MNRRNFILSTSAVAAGFAITSPGSHKTWAPSNPQLPAVEPKWPHLDLIQSATQAASSHNTQPWKFHATENAISIFPDFQRRCPAVDPDDHHLFVSLGCATENLAQSALAKGLWAEAIIKSDNPQSIEIQWSPTKAIENPMFQCISSRQCTRTEFNGQALSASEISILAAAGTDEGVSCQMITDRSVMQTILEFVLHANTLQMKDLAFVKELKSWIRFNSRQAHESGDGLYSATTGSPSLPTWLGDLLFSTVFTVQGENEKYTKQIKSSSGIAIFSSEKNDIEHWVKVGRCYERFALQATAMDIRNAMINQPVEVQSVRPEFATFLGLGNRRPDLVVRFGKAPPAPSSMRRKLSEVLI
jgi:hypothetical protein